MRRTLMQALRNRGLVNAATDASEAHFAHAVDRSTSPSPHAVYCGYDPTAPSLHVGNLATAICLKHFALAGFQAIALIGGATALIGDPSGRDAERPLLDPLQVDAHAARIKECLEQVLSADVVGSIAPAAAAPAPPPTLMLNNLEWFREAQLLTFLRDVGKHARVSSMLNKQSVRSRLTRGEGEEAAAAEGMSFTEFSYQLLQAYDYEYLFRKHRCTVQVGGSDQWGNITAGVSLIHSLHGSATQVHGLTIPLITNAAGEKIGKSAGNAPVWLHDDMTSHFDFFQYFMRTQDADVERFLRLFTFLPLDTIQEVMREHELKPEDRKAQRVLADHVTQLVRGQDALGTATMETEALFSQKPLHEMDESELRDRFSHAPSHSITLDASASLHLKDVCVQHGLVASNNEFRRLISGGGLYINEEKVDDAGKMLSRNDFIAGSVCVLRAGKKKHVVLSLASEAQDQ